jgi:hypothetical protein
MEVWAEVPGHGFTCGEKGDVSVTLPKLGPGKSKAIDVEGLIAPDLVQADLVTAVFAPNCQPGSAPLSKRTYAYQPLAKTVPVLIGARNVKNQYTFKVGAPAPCPLGHARVGCLMGVVFPPKPPRSPAWLAVSRTFEPMKAPQPPRSSRRPRQSPKPTPP